MILILLPLFFILGILATISAQIIIDCLRIEKQRKRHRYYRRAYVIPTIDGVLA